MKKTLNLIAAACENGGIGKNGDLPWRLKSEMAYFTKMTTQTNDSNKKNAVIMGRVTWDCIPKKFRPLRNRLNVVISRNNNLIVDDGVLVFNSLDSAVETLTTSSTYRSIVDKLWIIGGSDIYKIAMESKYPCKVYLTKILKEYECDTFFPSIPSEFKEISDPDVPSDIQEENGVKYQYKIYQKLE